jgi:basic membrane lipoprotein Med (substrate-binding protein (PBP1-ABC) superfamily)
MIENVVSGTFSGGLKNYGLKEGGVEYVVDEHNMNITRICYLRIF